MKGEFNCARAARQTHCILTGPLTATRLPYPWPISSTPCPAECTIETLWSDWEDGIVLKDGTRTAPMRVLEHPLLRKVWRLPGLRTAVSHRKAVIYAIHRRLHGLARQTSELQTGQPLAYLSMSLGEAKAELEGMRGGKGKALTVTELSRKLGPTEMTPADYEKAYKHVLWDM